MPSGSETEEGMLGKGFGEESRRDLESAQKRRGAETPPGDTIIILRTPSSAYTEEVIAANLEEVVGMKAYTALSHG